MVSIPCNHTDPEPNGEKWKMIEDNATLCGNYLVQSNSNILDITEWKSSKIQLKLHEQCHWSSDWIVTRQPKMMSVSLQPYCRHLTWIPDWNQIFITPLLLTKKLINSTHSFVTVDGFFTACSRSYLTTSSRVNCLVLGRIARLGNNELDRMAM